jgi:predicted DNA-binding transcriptional regulator YafY
MTRYERVEDILRLAIDMQNSYQGFSIQDIQDEFDVSRRTAIRMKDAVQRLFPSIEEVQNPLSRIKKWRLNKSPLNKMISFTAEELAELENCKSMMKNLNYTNRCDLLSEIMAKINMINESKSVATDVEALLEVEGYAVRQHPRYRMNLSTLNVISDALKSFKYLSFIYENNKGENAKLKIQPYGIIYGEKTYLLGYNVEKEGFRYYLLHKIKDAKILDEYFDKDEKFDLKNYLSNSFGVYQEKPMKIKLLFSEKVKDAIKDYNLHPTQKIKQNPDGTTTVTLEAGGRYEICWHLFRWGDNVKILEPQELKDTYNELLKNAMKQI